MLKRCRTVIAVGAGAITACVVVDMIALLFGASAASSIGIFVDPLVGIAVAVALAAIVVGLVARRRRRRCAGNACGIATRR